MRKEDQRVAARRRRSRLLSTLLIVVGVVLLAVAGGLWGTARWRYHEQDVVNQQLAAYATVRDNEPDAPQSLAPEVDWAGLKAINDDVVGWLQVPGTTINYPVYQGEDNEHYLRHSALGDWTLGGQLFIDCENAAPGMVDSQTYVYGHHLLDGSMFEQIAAMDDQARFDEIGTVWYVTEQTAWECEPLFVYYVHEYDTEARTFTFDDAAAFRGGKDAQRCMDFRRRTVLRLLGRRVCPCACVRPREPPVQLRLDEAPFPHGLRRVCHRL